MGTDVLTTPRGDIFRLLATTLASDQMMPQAPASESRWQCVAISSLVRFLDPVPERRACRFSSPHRPSTELRPAASASPAPTAAAPALHDTAFRGRSRWPTPLLRHSQPQSRAEKDAEWPLQVSVPGGVLSQAVFSLHSKPEEVR